MITHAYNPSTEELRQEGHLEFEANLGYIQQDLDSKKKKVTGAGLERWLSG